MEDNDYLFSWSDVAVALLIFITSIVAILTVLGLTAAALASLAGFTHPWCAATSVAATAGLIFVGYVIAVLCRDQEPPSY